MKLSQVYEICLVIWVWLEREDYDERAASFEVTSCDIKQVQLAGARTPEGRGPRGRPRLWWWDNVKNVLRLLDENLNKIAILAANINGWWALMSAAKTLQNVQEPDLVCSYVGGNALCAHQGRSVLIWKVRQNHSVHFWPPTLLLYFRSTLGLLGSLITCGTVVPHAYPFISHRTDLDRALFSICKKQHHVH